MKYPRLALLIVFTLVFSFSAAAQRKFSGTVVDIVDGKTVVVETQTRGRIVFELQYIEVPEPEQQLHQTVREHLQQMTYGKEIEFLPRGITETKTIGQLFVGGVDVSQQMLRDGAAWHIAPEKSGQDAVESETYQTNERQAKAEKRGVWSIENLQPAWEFRARKEEMRLQQQNADFERNRSQNNQNKTASTSYRNRRLTPEEQMQANADVEIWANVNSSFSILPNGLYKSYDSAKRIGTISTPFYDVNFVADGLRQKAQCGIAYWYKGELTNTESSRFTVFCTSDAENKFVSKFKNAVIIADKQKLNLSKTFEVGTTVRSRQEILAFITNRDLLTKMANAKNLEIKLGQYTGTIGSDVQIWLKKLLEVMN